MVMGQRWTEVEEGWRGEDWKEKKKKKKSWWRRRFFQGIAGGRRERQNGEPRGKRARQEATVEVR